MSEDTLWNVNGDGAASPAAEPSPHQPVASSARVLAALGAPLTTILESSVDSIFITSIDGAIFEANAAGCALLGYTADEMRKLSREDVLDPNDRRLVPALELRLSGGAARARITLVKKDGQRFEGEVSSTRFDALDGTPYVWVRVRDLTELHRSESALNESALQLRALSEATFESAFVHEAGTILFTNAAAERTYRAAPGGLRGQALMDFVAPESRELVQRYTAEGNEGPYEAYGLRADGTTFPVEVQARNIEFAGKRARVVALRDLTARKRIEQELARADRMASLGTLAAGIAHEINNPLTFITTNLDAARRGLDSALGVNAEALRAALADACVGADRVRRIVQDMGVFARARDEETGPVELAPIATYAAGVARAEFRHRARLEVDVGNVPPVNGNETRLGQVLINLLVNAAQAIPEGAAERNLISLRARHHGSSHVAIEVSDTGSGMTPELVARAFDPFVTTKEGSGAGLGLSICHRIVCGLGGTIEAESELGRGSTFRVVLPVATRSLPARPAHVEAPPPSARRRRVLIVDDEAVLRRSLARLLGEDHEVVDCGSAQEALALLATGARFDAVLSDLMMPEMTGMDLYDALIESYPSVASRTVFLTGGVYTERAQRFLDGGVRYLDKPFTLDALNAALEAAMRS